MHTSIAFVTRHRLRAAQAAGVLALSSLLSACYVVPMQPTVGGPVQSPAAAAASAQQQPVASTVTFNARMYPANDLAAKYGAVQGTVTNDLHGRGIFTANVAGETYTGEATRNPGNSRGGMANGVGSRGGWMKCSYQMNSEALGTGQCELNNGARFTMHLGS